MLGCSLQPRQGRGTSPSINLSLFLLSTVWSSPGVSNHKPGEPEGYQSLLDGKDISRDVGEGGEPLPGGRP